MFFEILFLSIFIISFIVIVFIIVKRFPQIKSINTDIATKEVEDKQKKELLEQRLDRKIKGIFIKKNNDKKSFLERKMNSLENNIKQNQILETIDIFSKDKKNHKENIKKLFDEIDENIKKNDLINAENICFALLKHEKDNINILEKLSTIYLSKNDMQKVKETYEYIVTILKRNKGKLIDKEVLQKIAKYKMKIADYYYAEKSYRKTVDILNDLILRDENNPKLLDLLIECNIYLKNKYMAEKQLTKLIEINPENLKIKEFNEKISNMFKK